MVEYNEKDNWRAGTVAGMEAGLIAQNDQLKNVATRLYIAENDLVEMQQDIHKLQNYVAKQTPFTNEPVSCEWCNYYVCQCEDKEDAVVPNDRNDLVDALKVAHKGLKPNATVNQQNIAYYTVRSILNRV